LINRLTTKRTHGMIPQMPRPVLSLDIDSLPVDPLFFPLPLPLFGMMKTAHVGSEVGVALGAGVDGVTVGCADGTVEGMAVGMVVGAAVGWSVGPAVGITLGDELG
jgi:hypothetical protein